MMLVGSYTLNLYCENLAPNDGIHPWDAMQSPPEYTGRTQAECVAKARKDGWIVNNKRQCYCPKCAKQMRKSARA